MDFFPGKSGIISDIKAKEMDVLHLRIPDGLMFTKDLLQIGLSQLIPSATRAATKLNTRSLE